MKKIIPIASIYFFLFLNLLHGNELQKEESNNPFELMEKLVLNEEIPCLKSPNCVCIKFTPKGNTLPLRYSISRFCPRQENLTESKKRLLTVTNFTADWKKVEEGKWLNNMPHGSWISWYANGVKAAEGQFKEGKPVGIHQTWHENSKKSVTYRYIDGKEDGVWIYRDKNGVIYKRMKWDKGVFVSKEEL